MPKNKVNVGQNRIKLVPRTKCKIGGRKSSRSGVRMNNDQLLEIVNGSGRGRDKHKARMILASRGVFDTTPKSTEEVSEAA